VTYDGTSYLSFSAFILVFGHRMQVIDIVIVEWKRVILLQDGIRNRLLTVLEHSKVGHHAYRNVAMAPAVRKHGHSPYISEEAFQGEAGTAGKYG